MKNKYLKIVFCMILSMAIYHSKSQTLLTENFEGSFPPQGWTIINASANNFSWRQNIYNAVSGSKSMDGTANTIHASNCWAFTPALNLNSGVLYRVSYWYKVGGQSTYSEKFKVTIGNSPTIASQTTTIHDYTSVSPLNFVQGIDTFLVSASGNYNIAFNYYSAANQLQILLDSIVVKQVPFNLCSGTPSIGSATAPSEVAIDNSFTLNLSGNFSTYSGLSFQWQSSPTGTNSFTDIPGGTTVSFSTTENINKDYRCRVTCQNSGASGLSNIATVVCSNNGNFFRQKYNGNNANSSINGVHFLSATQGFAAFSNSIGYTQDSGQTFINRNITSANTDFNSYPVNNPLSFSANGVYAFSQDSILIYGDYAAEPAILFSANQGVSWKVVFHQPFSLNTNIANSVFDIKFFNNTTGVAINQKYLFYTINRGLTWGLRYQIPSNASSIFSKLSIPTPQTGYAIAGNKLVKTTTTSDYWIDVNNGLPSVSGLYLNNVSFVNANVGYILRDDNNSVYKTLNGGISWQKINNDTLSPVGGTDMYFTSENIGYVSGTFRYAVSKTSNGGVTWEICKRNTTDQYLNYGMKRLFFLNTQTGWACGKAEFLIMTTTGGNPTIPKAFFKTDTATISSTNTVKLINLSKPYYQSKWFKNGLQLSTEFNTSFQHDDIFRLKDTITLVVLNGGETDTLIQYQNYPVPNVPPPSITAFSPTSGVNGTSVVITGTNLYFTTSVVFGGVPAQSFIVNSNTSITAIVGLGSTGVIQIMAPNGNTIKAGFTHDGPPSINSFYPAKAGPGSTINIKGYNLSSTNSVSFGGLNVIRFKILSSTEIAATIGYGNSGNVRIIASNGTAINSGFVYTPAPVISSLSSDTGKIGSVITIYGANFSLIPDSNIVRFGSVKAIVTDALTNSINVVVPTGASFKPISITTNRLTAYSRKPFTVTFSGGGNAILPTHFSRTAFVKYKYIQGSTINDFNNDGNPDIVMASDNLYIPEFSIYQNKSSRDTVFLSPPMFYTVGVSRYYNMDYCDFDGDGESDIIDNRIDSFLSVHKNTSTTSNITFSNPVTVSTSNPASNGYNEPTYFRTSDYNGDGKPDILLTIGSTQYNSTQLSVYRNKSIGDSIIFDLNKTPFFCPKLYSLNSGDFDGDGKDDVVLNAKELYRNTSTIDSISFVFSGNISNAYFYYRTVIADVDGDGRNDIVAYDFSLSTFNILVLRNTSTLGNISFAAPYTISAGEQIQWIRVSDLDGDGRPDIVIKKERGDVKIAKNTSSTGNISFLGTATNFFNPGYYIAYNIQLFDISDMDGNGKPDIILYQPPSGTNVYDTAYIFRNTVGEPLKTCVNGNILLTSNLIGTSYQWQVSSDFINFTNLINGVYYAGTNTQNLQINNIPSAWFGYQYRCMINGNASEKFVIGFSNYWKGSVNNQWNNPANWSCGVVPDRNTDVYINAGTIIVNTNVTIRSLTTRPGVNISVGAGNALSVSQ